MEKPKGVLRSKAVWGAIFTLVSAFGLLPLGMQFDSNTGDLTVNVYNLVTALGVVGVPAGGILALLGRLVAKGPIKGLF